MKIILDTNVLIDALHDNFSYTWRIIDLVLQDKLQAFASDKIFKEYRLIIDRIGINSKDKQTLEKFFSKVNIVQPVKNIKNVIPDDPQDEKFIACAVASRANYIISSDAHLLRLEKFKNIKILSPKDFWFEYKKQKPSADDEWKEVFKDMFQL